MQRRQATRHDVELLATLEVEGQPPEETYIRNLSLGGAFLETTQRLSMGARVQVTFRVPTQDDPITTGAQVRWSSESGIGVQFDGLRAREVWSLNKFFEPSR